MKTGDEKDLPERLIVKQKEKGTYDSTCMSICNYAGEEMICQTCFMKKSEKVIWKTGTKDEKESILKAISDRLKIIPLIFFCMSYAYGGSLSLDIGQTSSQYNYFAVPNEDANKVDLPEAGFDSYRLTAWLDVSDSTHFYFLFAPLTGSYDFRSEDSFRFNDTNFATNTATTVDYKFNSYRVGYFKSFKFSSSRVWLGGVFKIRDAFIQVTQGSSRDKFSNVGPVPLIGLGGEYYFPEGLKLYTHLDALGASQGSAYDWQIEVRYKLLGLGYRILGGGADNDRVLNFAQFNTSYLSININF